MNNTWKKGVFFFSELDWYFGLADNKIGEKLSYTYADSHS